MNQKLAVVQDAERPVPVEVLATSIKSIAEGVRKLRAGPLNDTALFLLIQHTAPSSAPLSLKSIKAVFDGINALETTYLRKRPVK